MAKRPTSRAAKPRTPATGRRNTKPTTVKASGSDAAVTRRAKTPASGTRATGGKSKTAEGRSSVEAGLKKVSKTTGASPTTKPARLAKARDAATPPVGKAVNAAAPKIDKKKPFATAARKGKGVAARAATKVTKPVAKPTKAKAGAVKAAKSTAPKKTAPRKRRPPSPAYLAAELGQPLDHDGEPVGAGAAIVADDRDLQDYTLHLWRQMQSGRSINKHLQAVERAGLNLDDVWMVGVKETLKTTSTPEEAQLYRKKLLFRANLLEAILSETVSKLVRLDHRADVGGETEAS